MMSNRFDLTEWIRDHQTDAICPHCSGKGVHPKTKHLCNQCQGTGHVLEPLPLIEPPPSIIESGEYCKAPETWESPILIPVETHIQEELRLYDETWEQLNQVVNEATTAFDFAKSALDNAEDDYESAETRLTEAVEAMRARERELGWKPSIKEDS